MEKILSNLTEAVGNTPLLRLSRYGRTVGARAEILAKLEGMNPLSSVKDRAALQIIETAEAEGRLRPGAVIIEATSGNMGIGLAFAAAVKGYRMVIVMPDSMSVERQKIMAMLGAEIVLTPGAKGMQGAVDKAEELAASTEGAFIAGQFENPANAEAHRKTTGPEIIRDTDGRLDIFVAGVGTGGTITGVGETLKAHIPGVQVVAVEPSDSPLLSGGQAGPHGLQGLGANFIPGVLNTDVYDAVMQVTTEEAYAAARLAARTEGLLVGISAGAALHAATELACAPENAGKRIVVLLPDTGERYLSTPLFDLPE
ncbi:MAG TPA: cysteine synthase A [Firmicutes bacterium]|nr:cysteine synthase A [Bacillota bacterium]